MTPAYYEKLEDTPETALKEKILMKGLPSNVWGHIFSFENFQKLPQLAVINKFSASLIHTPDDWNAAYQIVRLLKTRSFKTFSSGRTVRSSAARKIAQQGSAYSYIQNEQVKISFPLRRFHFQGDRSLFFSGTQLGAYLTEEWAVAIMETESRIWFHAFFRKNNDLLPLGLPYTTAWAFEPETATFCYYDAPSKHLMGTRLPSSFKKNQKIKWQKINCALSPNALFLEERVLYFTIPFKDGEATTCLYRFPLDTPDEAKSEKLSFSATLSGMTKERLILRSARDKNWHLTLLDKHSLLKPKNCEDIVFKRVQHLHADDNQIVLVHFDGSLETRHGLTGRSIRKMRVSKGVGTVYALSVQNNLAALIADKSAVEIWNLDTGQCILTLQHSKSQAIAAVHLGSDCYSLAIQMANEDCFIWHPPDKWPKKPKLVKTTPFQIDLSELSERKVKSKEKIAK